MQERLQKYLARAGVASRRTAEEIIQAGRVTVNGQVVIIMGSRVDPARDLVAVDGIPVSIEAKIYLLLHKPAGYVTTLNDPQGRPIVTDLLQGIGQRVFPVGRLDLDTEGALLLTNDGRLSQYVLHPRFEVKKTYLATVQGSPNPDKIRRLEQGVVLEGVRTWPARIRMLDCREKTSTLEIIIHEGKKRQVRKMFAAIGHPVLYLKRTAYGGLSLGALAKGKYRRLSTKDLEKIFFGRIPFTIEKLPD